MTIIVSMQKLKMDCIAKSIAVLFHYLLGRSIAKLFADIANNVPVRDMFYGEFM